MVVTLPMYSAGVQVWTILSDASPTYAGCRASAFGLCTSTDSECVRVASNQTERACPPLGGQALCVNLRLDSMYSPQSLASISVSQRLTSVYLLLQAPPWNYCWIFLGFHVGNESTVNCSTRSRTVLTGAP